MDEYTVSVSNSFEADSHEDAVMQMVAWLLDNAGQAGYRVIKHEEGSYEIFIDAEDVDPGSCLNCDKPISGGKYCSALCEDMDKHPPPNPMYE